MRDEAEAMTTPKEPWGRGPAMQAVIAAIRGLAQEAGENPHHANEDEA